MWEQQPPASSSDSTANDDNEHTMYASTAALPEPEGADPLQYPSSSHRSSLQHLQSSYYGDSSRQPTTPYSPYDPQDPAVPRYPGYTNVTSLPHSTSLSHPHGDSSYPTSPTVDVYYASDGSQRSVPTQPSQKRSAYPTSPQMPYSLSGYPPSSSVPNPSMTAPQPSSYRTTAPGLSPYPYGPGTAGVVSSVGPLAGDAYGSGGASSYPASPSRPFACDICPLSFARHHDLKRHRDTHTGEKPHVCPACGKSYSRKDALSRHQILKQCGPGSSSSD